MSEHTEPGAVDKEAVDEEAVDKERDAEVASVSLSDETAAGAGAAVSRPSPSARARRIGGGRPSPSPRPSPNRRPAPAADDTEPVRRGVKLAKRPRPTPSGAAGESGGPRHGDTGRSADTERLRQEIERLRWIPAVVAAGVVAVLVVLCVWQSHGVWWGKDNGGASSSQQRQQVLAVAKPCVAAIVSYDYRKLAASEKAGQACITGKFKDDYTKAMETTVKTLAPQTKTVQVFQVAKAGIERVSPDGKQWVVLLYGQQQVTNTATAKDKPRLDILNVEATLNQVGGKWLVSAIR
jgi:hypothetical protein